MDSGHWRLVGCVLMMMLGGLVSSPVMAQEIVAHRGASHEAPENTLAAYHLAWELGADAAECDLRITSDGEVVLMHDADTKRVTGGKAVLRISDTPLSELKRLDVGSWKGPEFAQQRIPTLAEFLAAVPDDKRVFLEAKSGPEIVPMLLHAIDQASIRADQVVVIAFDAEVIAALKARTDKIKACWLTGLKRDAESGAQVPSTSSILGTLARIKADGLDCQANLDVLESGLAREVREAGYELHVWTVNHGEAARSLRDLGVSSITTNRPRYLRDELGARD